MSKSLGRAAGRREARRTAPPVPGRELCEAGPENEAMEPPGSSSHRRALSDISGIRTLKDEDFEIVEISSQRFGMQAASMSKGEAPVAGSSSNTPEFGSIKFPTSVTGAEGQPAALDDVREVVSFLRETQPGGADEPAGFPHHPRRPPRPPATAHAGSGQPAVQRPKSIGSALKLGADEGQQVAKVGDASEATESPSYSRLFGSPLSAPVRRHRDAEPLFEGSERDFSCASTKESRQGRYVDAIYAKFLSKLESPLSSDLRMSIHHFVRHFTDHPPDSPDMRCQEVRAFLESLSSTIEGHVSFKGLSRDEMALAKEGIEKYTLLRVYEMIFPPHGPADIKADRKLARRIESLAFIRLEHLEVKDPGIATDKLTSLAVSELHRMGSFHSPRDKLVCIVNACKALLAMLSSRAGEAIGADDFLPVLIFVTLQSNPPRLHSNLEFISTFRRPASLLSESGCYFTHVLSAVAFIRGLTARALKISEEEFARLKADREELLENRDRDRLRRGLVSEAVFHGGPPTGVNEQGDFVYADGMEGDAKSSDGSVAAVLNDSGGDIGFSSFYASGNSEIGDAAVGASRSIERPQPQRHESVLGASRSPFSGVEATVAKLGRPLSVPLLGLSLPSRGAIGDPRDAARGRILSPSSQNSTNGLGAGRPAVRPKLLATAGRERNARGDDKASRTGSAAAAGSAGEEATGGEEPPPAHAAGSSSLSTWLSLFWGASGEQAVRELEAAGVGDAGTGARHGSTSPPSDDEPPLRGASSEASAASTSSEHYLFRPPAVPSRDSEDPRELVSVAGASAGVCSDTGALGFGGREVGETVGGAAPGVSATLDGLESFAYEHASAESLTPLDYEKLLAEYKRMAAMLKDSEKG